MGNENKQENDLGITFSNSGDCLYFKSELDGEWVRVTESDRPNDSVVTPRKNMIAAVLAIKAGKLDAMLGLTGDEVYDETADRVVYAGGLEHAISA